MSSDSLRDLLRAQPFVPFEVHMWSGDVLLTGASLYIWYPQTDPASGHVVRCSLLHVTGVEYAEKRVKKKGGKQ